MDFEPKVSIIIPVYNGSDFLRQAIDSALSQEYPNIEILVVNDGSNDGGASEKIAMEYGDKIRYFSKKNGGVASALNVGIKEMTGDYFSWLSHDDLYFPNKVKSQIQALSGMQQAKTILYANYEIISENREVITKVMLPNEPSENFRYFITVKNILHGCTLLIPKTAFEECGLFNESLRTTQDYDLWFKMAEKYDFVHIPHVIVKARAHAGQGGVNMQEMALIEINDLLIEFISNLKEHEIISATNKSLCLSYVQIYSSMLQRGFDKTAIHAKKMVLKCIKGGSLLNIVRTLFMLLLSGVICTQIGWLRSSLVWHKIIRPLKNKYFSSQFIF